MVGDVRELGSTKGTGQTNLSYLSPAEKLATRKVKTRPPPRPHSSSHVDDTKHAHLARALLAPRKLSDQVPGWYGSVGKGFCFSRFASVLQVAPRRVSVRLLVLSCFFFLAAGVKASPLQSRSVFYLARRPSYPSPPGIAIRPGWPAGCVDGWVDSRLSYPFQGGRQTDRQDRLKRQTQKAEERDRRTRQTNKRQTDRQRETEGGRRTHASGQLGSPVSTTRPSTSRHYRHSRAR